MVNHGKHQSHQKYRWGRIYSSYPEGKQLYYGCMTTLYLTASERTLFEALPDSLQSEWPIEEETLTAYESFDILKMRADISPLSRHPLLKDMFEKVKGGGSLDGMKIPDLSDEDIADFFFTIGARGLAGFIEMLLKETKTDEDIRSLSAMSEMRHKLLEINASVSQSSL